MYLTELNIDGFGTFSNYNLPGLQPGINILYGGNEAGKSTLLQFIRFTLFGYPRLLEQRLAPVFGGNHGGRVKGLLADGSQVILERTAGYPGDIQLHVSGVTSDRPEDWSRLLGHASGDLFENVYAFSLDELVGLESLNRSGVEDKIFSVGLGLKNLSIKDLGQTLTAQMETIYKPRGSKQRAIQLLREIEEHHREINALQLHLPQFQKLSQDIERHQQALRKTEQALADRQSRYDTLCSYSKSYESFVIIRDIDRELSALPDWREYPEKGLTRLEQLEAEEVRLRRTISDLQDDRAAVESDKTGDYNQAFVERTAEVEKLALNLEKYKSWVDECREERLVLENLNQSIRQRIAAINADWAEDNILAFTNMIAHHDRLDVFQKRLETLQKNQDRLATEISLLKARRPKINAQNACVLVGSALVIGASALIIFRNFVWGTVLLLVGLILLAGRKLPTMEDPLKESLQASGWLDAEKAMILNEYRQYVDDELGLPAELSPEAVQTALQLIEQVARDIVARDRHQNRIAEKEIFIRAFETELDGLAKIFNVETVETDKSLLAARILREHKEALALRNKAIEKESEVKRLRAEQQKAGQLLSRAGEEIDRLLASIQATDRDDFKKKFHDNSRVGVLREQRRQALRTIEQIAGIHDSQNVIAFLSDTEKPALEKELRQTESRVQVLREERDGLNRTISAAFTLREQLQTSSHLAEAMTRLATCRENLSRCYHEWLAAKLAEDVLQQVKSQFEQKKQPAIIQHSSSFFRQITGGRYQRIQVSLEDGKVLVFDDSDAAKRIDQLSRGTREQLLISIRLGFIEEYEKKTEPLPLILDEVLVNFDHDRAARSAAILHDFSAHRQTLLFTCHPETHKLFQHLPVNLITI